MSTAEQTGLEAGQTELGFGSLADSAMTIPGKGESGDRCGEYVPIEFCEVCGEPHFGEHRCGRRTCPDCWIDWRNKRAVNITKRLGAARYAAESGLEKRAIHAVLSPPDGEIETLEDVKQGYRDAYRLAEEKGVRGGVAIFHGWRVVDSAKERWRRETNGGDNGPKLWAWVREQPRMWRSLVEWSPHYHVLGLSEDFEADDPDAQDGWVARRLRTLDSFYLNQSGGYEDMARTAAYLLSHAGFETDSTADCVRWFGELATAKFSPESVDVYSRIEEMAEAAIGYDDETGDGDEESESKECRNCGAEGQMCSIFDAGVALSDRRWCEDIGKEQQRRLSAAFKWAIGDVPPPPGYKHPTTEDGAGDALDALTEAYDFL